MAINYTHPETGEITYKEVWRWVCIFNDGTTLEQFETSNGQAIFHRFAEIDQTKIRQFKMVHDTHPPVQIDLPIGAKLHHFYTTAVVQIPASDGENTITLKYKGYKVGYSLNGKDYGILIDHDNSINLINDFKAANLATGA